MPTNIPTSLPGTTEEHDGTGEICINFVWGEHKYWIHTGDKTLSLGKKMIWQGPDQHVHFSLILHYVAKMTHSL